MTTATAAPDSVDAILRATGMAALRADSSAEAQETALRALGANMSRALTAALAELEGRPWAEICRGRPVTDRLVARLLGRFRVKPKSIRIGDATPKGYLRDDLADAFARYLAASAATSATTSESPFGGEVKMPPPSGGSGGGLN